MRSLITGSRNWTDEKVLAQALHEHTRNVDPSNVIVVHGACSTGADRIARDIAELFRFNVEAHPANWRANGRAAGPIRNKHMVALGADLCLAFPLGESRGTRGCMDMAERAGIPVIVHEQD